MNIQRISKVMEAYQANTKRPVTQSSKGHELKDSVTISQEARLYDFTKKALAGVPDVRQEKINEIKARIEKGEYGVSAMAIAEKIIR